LGLQSLPHETDPDTPEIVKKFDKKVTKIVEAILEEGKNPTDAAGFSTIAPVLKSLYERNLHICAAVLVKDYIRTRDHASRDRQQVVQANLQNAVHSHSSLWSIGAANSLVSKLCIC